MKYQYIITGVISLILSACGNSPQNEKSEHHSHDGMHVHENGEVHQHNDTIAQEEFNVITDSTGNQHDIHEQPHDSGGHHH
jgi:hypothetical protein